MTRKIELLIRKNTLKDLEIHILKNEVIDRYVDAYLYQQYAEIDAELERLGE